MSRSAVRRMVVLAAAASCVAAAAVPAVAQSSTESFPVTITTTGGSRLFDVTKPDGTDLTRFDFGPGGQLPWRVVVTDTGMPLIGNDYAVNTKMSNLYYQEEQPDGTFTTDYATKIASDNLSLGYGLNPLGAIGLSLPVVPEIRLSGALTCGDFDLFTLVGDLLDACVAINALAVGTNAVDAKVLAPVQSLDTADLTAAAGGVLDLANLPLALLGAQEGGRFTNPAKADAGDPETGASATSKRIMTGTGQLAGDTLSMLTTALTSQLGGTPLTPMEGAGSLLTIDQVLAGLSSQPALAPIASLLGNVPDAEALSVLQNVVGALEAVTGARLSTMSGTYSALPILAAQATTVKPGLYQGTLTVDFFQE